jgi:hypothetical protein
VQYQTKNLQRSKRLAVWSEFLLLGIAIFFDHAHPLSIVYDVELFVVTYLLQRMFEIALSRLRVAGLPASAEVCVRAMLLVALVPIALIQIAHRPTSMSSYFMLYAEEILSFVEVFGNWEVVLVPSVSTPRAHRRCASFFYVGVVRVRVSTTREDHRTPQRTTPVRNKASPSSGLALFCAWAGSPGALCGADTAAT